MKVIQIENITKDYGNDRGVFDVSFEIEKGGDSVSSVQIHSDKGCVRIDGKRVQDKYYETNARIGYLPREINFPDGMKGMELIRWTAELRRCKDLSKAYQLIELLDLKNADSKVKRMSKGMKQKIGIVCAFMHDPDIRHNAGLGNRE